MKRQQTSPEQFGITHLSTRRVTTVHVAAAAGAAASFDLSRCFEVEPFAWVAGQRRQGLVGVATFERLVTSVELGHRLLHKGNPQLAPRRICKRWDTRHAHHRTDW